ncbi:hypothetical protein QTL86_18495 [Cellulosilyticum sp. ST5]|uniref:hypothetical protein n=1 Tax=unclassified Cellulosilyticum TaxID=2643091 RepID=UPI000F8DBBB5|nr:hypothetical protein [Cellulosilyticum sp. WCF-2]QEH67393.1 hypothetical protein EKH84_02655 [Cellulosilyticum sp. WCF-2]
MIFLGILLGFISFSFLCEGFNKMEIKVFESLQKKTRALLKKKKVYQYTIFGVLAIIALFITVLVGAGEFPQGFLLGTIWALIDFVFEDSLFDKLRNNLR